MVLRIRLFPLKRRQMKQLLRRNLVAKLLLRRMQSREKVAKYLLTLLALSLRGKRHPLVCKRSDKLLDVTPMECKAAVDKRTSAIWKLLSSEDAAERKPVTNETQVNSPKMKALFRNMDLRRASK